MKYYASIGTKKNGTPQRMVYGLPGIRIDFGQEKEVPAAFIPHIRADVDKGILVLREEDDSEAAPKKKSDKKAEPKKAAKAKKAEEPAPTNVDSTGVFSAAKLASSSVERGFADVTGDTSHDEGSN